MNANSNSPDPKHERTADPEDQRSISVVGLSRLLGQIRNVSERPDVLCFLALTAGSDVELDALSFLQ
jgi:hypothetical protein